jgi:hypothetical protein
MTERVLGPTGGRRRKRLALLVPFLALAALILAIAAAAGPIGTASGFEDDDGNLNPQAPISFDWNSFDPTTWTGTAPFRQSQTSASGWSFKGVEDAQATTSDTGFAGGTKQDDNCPSVITAKAPNKDDLKRIYLASKTGANGHTYLNLAWVRIPQNTTSASAHVGFEFNKGSSACAGPGGLVNRSAGDMLIVNDFEGGAGSPVITLRRWVTSGACEVSSNSPPCWGPAVNLTASNAAEAKVNTGSSASDTIAPSDETLADSEFGEAGIDLTNAGVFTAGVCESFGTAYAVSRSSGNSGTAQMKDLAGPVPFSLTNCGQIKIIKHTNPRGVNQSFGFTSTIPSTSSCVQDVTPAGFSLNDSGNTSSDNAANTEDCTNVPAGTYTVTEGANPTGFTFANFSCTSSGTGSSTTPTSSTTQKNVSITIAGGGVVTCTYTNDQNLGAIKVTKTRKFASATTGNPLTQPQSGVSFTVNGVTKQTGSNGVACFDGLAFATYSVTETVPSGYVADGTNPKSVTVDTNAKCDDATYVGETVSFSNTPTTDLSIDVVADDPGATKSTVSCVDSDGDAAGTAISTAVDPANFDASNLLPDTYTCTIVIDP